jgi:hypothetical protein
MRKKIFTMLVSGLLIGGLHAQNIEVPQNNRPLVMKHSATWCPPCGGTPWTTFDNLVDNYGNYAVFMQVHKSYSSLFYSPNASDLINNCNQTYAQPEFFYNTTRIGSGSSSHEATISSNISADIEEASVAQTGIAFYFDEGSDLLNVDTKTRFFSGAEGDFYLSVFLVIKDTVAFQEARGPNELHEHVLKQALTEDTFGDLIMSGNVSSGTELHYSVSAEMPSDMTMDQVEIATVLWRKTGEGYEVVNANVQQEASERTTTARPDLTRLQAGFIVAPNVIQSHFNVRLDLEHAYEYVGLTLFNLLGQPVGQLYGSSLYEGEHQFRYERSAGLHPGIYLLRLRAGEEIVTRRLLLH